MQALGPVSEELGRFLWGIWGGLELERWVFLQWDKGARAEILAYRGVHAWQLI